MALTEIINKNLKEALDHIACPWALGSFPSLTALRMGLQKFGIEDTTDAVMHFYAGGMLGTLGFDLARQGKKGAAAAIITATAFNVLWEIMEAAGGFSKGLNTFDTYADLFAVYLGTAVALGFEYLRHRNRN